MIGQAALVFTDLDGTLLDHDSYDPGPALPALAELGRLGIPWMPATSKTAAELVALRERLDCRHPAILENGGAVWIPRGYFDADEAESVTTLGVPYDEVRAVLLRLRDRFADFLFEGFGDMTDARVAELTGLATADAAAARKRACSEPLLWEGTEEARERFAAELSDHGLRLVRGGRFFSAQGTSDKADGVAHLRRRFEAGDGRVRLIIAAGDSENDRRMLEAADIPIVIAKADGSRLRIDDDGRAIHPSEPGPAGFRQGLGDALARSGAERTEIHG